MSGKAKLKKTQAMTRQEAAAWLASLAETLAAGGAGEVSVAGEKVTLYVADQISTEIKIELSCAAPPTPGVGTTAPAGTPT